jgi:Septin
MSPTELRVIRRLMEHVNVLPVIGHADCLTNDKLHAVKAPVKQELYEADIGFGVFAPKPMKFSDTSSSGDATLTARRKVSPTVNGHGEISSAVDKVESESDDDDGVHALRPIIRLCTGQKSAPVYHSRSCSWLELTEEALEPQSPNPMDPEIVANMCFSAPTIAWSDLSPLLPFAIIAPKKYHSH